MSANDRSREGGFLDPDPRYVDEDETVEIVAVDLMRTFEHTILTRYRIDWRAVAAETVYRVRELDGQASGRAGILFVILAAALAGALIALIIVGLVS